MGSRSGQAGSTARARGAIAGLAALAALASAPGRAGAIPAEGPGVHRPAETADAVLVAEKLSWDRHLHDALRLPEWIDLAFEQRTRFEFLEGPFRPGEPDTQTQFPQRTRLRLGVDGPGPLRWLAELQDSRTWGDGPDDFTRNQNDHLDVLQLFASARALDLFGLGLRGDAHVGRMTLDLGSRRLVARNSFRNTTNAFDGAHLQLGSDERDWRVRGFFALPVRRGEDVFDDPVSTWQLFWGVAYEDLRIAWLNVDATYLGLDDRRGNRDYHSFGARAYRKPAERQLDYELELIGQVGERGTLDHSAFAGHAELGYTLPLPWSPRLVAQFDYASGSDDADESHAFDPLFGARRFDLDPTGIYGPFARSNILSPGVRLLVAPLPGVKAGIKVRYWELAKARDAFAGTGLRDPSGAAGRRLGTDVELWLQWSPLAWLTLETGYDHWFKGSYMDEVPGAASNDDADYFYVQTLLRF